MSDYYVQLATIISAYGGLVLGIINTIFLIYHHYFRSGVLNVEIEKASIRYAVDNEEIYDYHINILINADLDDVYIKNIKLINDTEVFGEFTNQSKELRLTRAWNMTNEDLLDSNLDEFENTIETGIESSIYVRDLLIEKGEQRSLSFVGRFIPVRMPDGYKDVHYDNWSLVVEYEDRTESVPFSFERHDRSER
jgi:hypothetical protein